MPLQVSNNIIIQDWEITEHFDRASGSGGQRVNKVSTKVTLRFEAERSPNLSDQVKVRLKKFAGSKWTVDGAIVLQVDDHRSQVMNRELARERLVELIRKALVVQKKRRATKPTRGSVERRIKAKKTRSEVKSLRGKVEE